MADSTVSSSSTYGAHTSSISSPLAPEKLNSSLLKLIRKCTEVKNLKRGVKEVVKSIRKGLRGLCILAGDISPIDVISHIPILCEDHGIPYIYSPSKSALGAAAGTKRPTSVVLIPDHSSYEDKYSKALEKVKALQPVF